MSQINITPPPPEDPEAIKRRNILIGVAVAVAVVILGLIGMAIAGSGPFRRDVNVNVAQNTTGSSAPAAATGSSSTVVVTVVISPTRPPTTPTVPAAPTTAAAPRPRHQLRPSWLRPPRPRCSRPSHRPRRLQLRWRRPRRQRRAVAPHRHVLRRPPLPVLARAPHLRLVPAPAPAQRLSANPLISGCSWRQMSSRTPATAPPPRGASPASLGS